MTLVAPWPDCPRCPGVKLTKSIQGELKWICQKCGYERKR